MKEQVSVKKAIKRGTILLVVAPLIAMTIVFGTVIFLMIQKILDGPLVIVLMLVAGISAGWLVWSFNVVRWKLWAYENVRNVHELNRKAIEANLIWPDGSWSNKTEIWTYTQKQKFNRLKKKFDLADEYHDDLFIPKETRLFYSKNEVYLGFLIGSFLLFLFFYTYSEKLNFIMLLLPLLGFYFIYRGFKKFRGRNQPQLILDDKGIYIEKFRRKYLWDKIIEVTVSVDKSGSYLNLQYIEEEAIPLDTFHREEEDTENAYHLHNIATEINEFNMSVDNIEQRVYVYRKRHEKNNPDK